MKFVKMQTAVCVMMAVALLWPAIAAAQCPGSWANGFAQPTCSLNGPALASAVFDDGTGSMLYVGGSFTAGGFVSANNVAKWNGAAWSPLASGMNGAVRALTVHTAPNGESSVFVGGDFTTAGAGESESNGG